jgi:hypothetical protein
MLKTDNVPEYTGRIENASPAFPHGSMKDETTPGADDGTPSIAKQWNDFLGFQQSVSDEAGVDPNNTVDSVSNPQLLTLLKTLMTAPPIEIALDISTASWSLDATHLRFFFAKTIALPGVASTRSIIMASLDFTIGTGVASYSSPVILSYEDDGGGEIQVLSGSGMVVTNLPTPDDDAVLRVWVTP